MAYVPVPKDMTVIKTKVMFNLTKRQLICFSCGALMGVPLFFFLKPTIGTSAASLCMIIAMLPFFLLAMYEKNGQPLEKILGNIIKVAFVRPQKRPMQTNNFYSAVEKQQKLDSEINSIAKKEKLSRADKQKIKSLVDKANQKDKKVITAQETIPYSFSFVFLNKKLLIFEIVAMQ